MPIIDDSRVDMPPERCPNCDELHLQMSEMVADEQDRIEEAEERGRKEAWATVREGCDAIAGVADCPELDELRAEVETLKDAVYRENQLAAEWAVELGVLKDKLEEREAIIESQLCAGCDRNELKKLRSVIEGLLSLCRGHQSHHCGCDCSGHNSPDEPTCREAWAAAREAVGRD